MAITGSDERIHRVEDPSEHWSDSLYFNCWDPGSGLFLLTRIAVMPNVPATTAGLLVWIDGRPAYGYGHTLDDVPLADWDDLRVAALRYVEGEPLRSWEVTLEDGANRAVLRWEGFTGTVDYSDNRQPLPRSVAWGHYEQTCRVTGSIDVQGRQIKVDGVGQRDHSWGVRHWAGVQEWHWITGFLGGAQRSFNLFEVHQADGTVTYNGFVHDAGEDLLVVDAVRRTDQTDGGAPQAVALELIVEGGRRFSVEGTPSGAHVPVRPGGEDTVVHEQPMRMRSDDGLEGYGIYELLANGGVPPRQ